MHRQEDSDDHLVMPVSLLLWVALLGGILYSTRFTLAPLSLDQKALRSTAVLWNASDVDWEDMLERNESRLFDQNKSNLFLGVKDCNKTVVGDSQGHLELDIGVTLEEKRTE